MSSDCQLLPCHRDAETQLPSRLTAGNVCQWPRRQMAGRVVRRPAVCGRDVGWQAMCCRDVRMQEASSQDVRRPAVCGGDVKRPAVCGRDVRRPAACGRLGDIRGSVLPRRQTACCVQPSRQTAGGVLPSRQTNRHVFDTVVTVSSLLSVACQLAASKLLAVCFFFLLHITVWLPY
jgi:hypothetical protein